MAWDLDPQQAEVIGRNWLVGDLVRAGWRSPIPPGTTASIFSPPRRASPGRCRWGELKRQGPPPPENRLSLLSAFR